jgi:hypothetical protein
MPSREAPVAIRYNIKSTEHADAETGKDADLHREEAVTGEACRCKETSRMTPGELFRLMKDDLLFWKKTNGKQTRGRRPTSPDGEETGVGEES